MNNVISVNVRDKALLDMIKDILKDKNYALTENTDMPCEDYNAIITDDLAFLDKDELKGNIKTPVLYISSGTGSIDDLLIREKNIFRAVVPNPDLNSVIDIPAKQSPVQNKSLGHIVNFLVDANNLIDKFSLLIESDVFTKKLKDEQHFTEIGDYGLPGMPQAELQQIRGVKRRISDVEAAYQAVQVFKIFNSLNKKIEGLSSNKILFLSPEPKRMFKYARFLEAMTSSIVEVIHEHDAPSADTLIKGYSLIIYDTSRFDSPMSLTYLERLINEAWKNKTEILTMCNTERMPTIISDSKIGYKFRNFMPENPNYRVFLETVAHILELQSKRAIAYLIDSPENALFSEAIANLNNSDPLVFERGKRQLLYGIALKTGKNYPDLLDLEVNATDELFFGTTPLKLTELGKLIKIFKDDRRAKCETQALRCIRKHNAHLDEICKQIENSPGDVSKKQELYFQNAPRINTRKEAVDSGRILIGQYIFGPTLDRLGPEISRRISAGDKTATDFRNQVIFEMNKYCAFFQINELDLEDIAVEKTQFSEDFPNIINNLKTLQIPMSSAEYKCADFCAEIFDINIRDPASTQYFDFYWDNIIIETGNDMDSFDNVLSKKKSEDLNMQQFVEKYIYRIDFNKTYRRTSMTEDPSRWAVKNFMRSPPKSKQEREVIEEDRDYFYTHLLLHRKKFKLLKEVMSPTCSDFNDLAAKVDELSKIITKWENRPGRITDNEKVKIEDYIAEEKENFFYTERYVTAYRLTRHSILLFNSIKDKQKKLKTGRLTQEEFDRNIDYIEQDLRNTYTHTRHILRRIIDQKEDCLKKNKWDVKKYKPLIDDMNKELTADIAKQARDCLKEIKKIQNPGEREAIFTYISANYLSAFCKKVARSHFKIDYTQFSEE